MKLQMHHPSRAAVLEERRDTRGPGRHGPMCRPLLGTRTLTGATVCQPGRVPGAAGGLAEARRYAVRTLETIHAASRDGESNKSVALIIGLVQRAGS